MSVHQLSKFIVRYFMVACVIGSIVATYPQGRKVHAPMPIEREAGDSCLKGLTAEVAAIGLT